MPDIRSGQIYTFYLFDVAETVDLAAVPALIGGPTVAARLAPKSATPAYVQYEKPPLSFDGDLIGIADIAGFRPPTAMTSPPCCAASGRISVHRRSAMS